MRFSAVVACVLLLTVAQAAEAPRIGPASSADAILAARPRVEPALELTYDVKGGSQPGTITLDLAPDFAIVTRDRELVIYDYLLRRLITLNDKAHSFTNMSLYGLVDVLVAETFNRRMQHQLLKGVNLSQGAALMDPFWVQSELHVMDPQDSTPSIDRRTDPNGSVHFLYGGKEVASYLPSKQVMTPDEAARLKKMLRYATQMHPIIIDDIGASGFVPQRLAFENPPMWKKPASEWTLQSAVPVRAVIPLRPGDKPALPPLPDSVAPLIPVMAAAKAGQAPDHRTVDDYRAAIEKSVGANPFQALVYALEASLQFGQQVLECPDTAKCHSLKQVFQMAERDPRAAIVLRALSPHSKEELEQAIKELRAMKRDDLSNAYVLDDWLANSLVESGQVEPALPLFVSAIKGNPYMAGYYKDIGDAFRFSFQPDRAWLFYDMGREIPGSNAAPVVAQWNAYEAQLAQTHPEFF